MLHQSTGLSSFAGFCFSLGNAVCVLVWALQLLLEVLASLMCPCSVTHHLVWQLA